MTGTLGDDGFKLSDITTSIKEETVTVSEFEANHGLGLLMADIEGYSPPQGQSTLQDKLQEISMLNNNFTVEDAQVSPFSVSGIEANDVCSLYKQFVEYEASDETLSYPESSVMSPMYSPGGSVEDVVLGTLMSVQEKLIEEVGESGSSSPYSMDMSEDLVVCYPNHDNLLRTVNGVHPKADSLRMADSPKFAKLKKKKVSNEPPLRNLSLPVTPRCTSPASTEIISQEERKDMEIKLIKALAQPISKTTIKPKKSCKDSANISKNSKNGLLKKSPACPNKRKLLAPMSEPVPSRLIPVVSKRFKNNLEQSKNMKDPRLKDMNRVNVDPRLSRSDYCSTRNTIHLNLTNIGEMDFSSTNTATETVDDMCILNMNIENDAETNAAITCVPTFLNNVKTLDATVDHGSLVKPHASVLADTGGVVFVDGKGGLEHGVGGFGVEEEVITTSEVACGITGKVTGKVTGNLPQVSNGFGGVSVNELFYENSSEVQQIVEFPSLAAIEIKTDGSECAAVKQAVKCNGSVNGAVKDASNSTVNGTVKINSAVSSAVNHTFNGVINSTDKSNSAVNGVVNGNIDNTVSSAINGTPNGTASTSLKKTVKPKKTYRKGHSKTPGTTNGKLTSDSENECDDDDRAYNRKHSKKTKNSKILPAAYIKTENCSSHSQCASKTPSTSRSASRQHSRSPSHRVRSVCHRRPSGSPDLTTRSPDRYSERFGSDEESEFSYHSDRSNYSDCENMDISNKLIELSNPVPYDIENERKLRFLTGHASKSIGERRNIYAGGITPHTTKAELAERFKRFGKIQKITLHFRDHGDNYAFIVFEEPDNAMRAIEEGNDDPAYPHLDLCFGGRRKFVGGSYVDFDGNNRYLEESDKGAIDNRTEPPEDDFDDLLRRALTETKKKEEKKMKKETTPEWT